MGSREIKDGKIIVTYEDGYKEDGYGEEKNVPTKKELEVDKERGNMFFKAIFGK